MFERFSIYHKILFTGPHRSGTTIGATMFAHDTGHGLIREELCRFSIEGVEHWMNTPNPVVIQAPFIADACHQFPDALVVFMHRNIEDIEASQKRMYLEDGGEVFWPRFELGIRGRYHTDDYSKTVAEIKYESWQEQKKRLNNYLDLEYESLSKHPLWVPKDQRKEFHVRQTSAVA